MGNTGVTRAKCPLLQPGALPNKHWLWDRRRRLRVLCRGWTWPPLRNPLSPTRAQRAAPGGALGHWGAGQGVWGDGSSGLYCWVLGCAGPGWWLAPALGVAGGTGCTQTHYWGHGKVLEALKKVLEHQDMVLGAGTPWYWGHGAGEKLYRGH